jgi:hypothetical protein
MLLVLSYKIPLIYTDTDSIACEATDDQVKLLNLGKALTQWKIEESAKRGKFLAPKAYILEDGVDSKGKHFDISVKLKGLDRNIIEKIEKANISIESTESELRLKHHIDERYSTLKESLRDGCIIESKCKTKYFTFKNDKRYFNLGQSEAWNDKTWKLFQLDSEKDDKRIRKLESYRPIYEVKGKSDKLSMVMHYFEDRFKGTWIEEQWERIENSFDEKISVEENITEIKKNMRC